MRDVQFFFRGPEPLEPLQQTQRYFFTTGLTTRYVQYLGDTSNTETTGMVHVSYTRKTDMKNIRIIVHKDTLLLPLSNESAPLTKQ